MLDIPYENVWYSPMNMLDIPYENAWYSPWKCLIFPMNMLDVPLEYAWYSQESRQSMRVEWKMPVEQKSKTY